MGFHNTVVGNQGDRNAFGVTVYIALDVGLGVTETIGAPANPPLSLQRIALYVPLSNLSTCGLTNFPFQLHRCLLPVDDSSCPHHSAGETPDDLLHHFPCHLRPISAGLVPPRQSDLRRTYLHFICQFFISNLRSVIGLKLTS